MIKYLGLAFLGFAGWHAYGNYAEKQAFISKVAAEYKLDETQLTAYKACNRQMSALQLEPENPNVKKINGSVPPSICACQAKHMVKVMNPDAYSSHKSVVDFLTIDNTSRTINLKESQTNSRYSAREGFSVLLSSLKSCISDYRSHRAAEKSKRIKEICSSGRIKGSQLCNS